MLEAFTQFLDCAQDWKEIRISVWAISSSVDFEDYIPFKEETSSKVSFSRPVSLKIIPGFNVDQRKQYFEIQIYFCQLT